MDSVELFYGKMSMKLYYSMSQDCKQCVFLVCHSLHFSTIVKAIGAQFLQICLYITSDDKWLL
jgi:hypothetical protein